MKIAVFGCGGFGREIMPFARTFGTDAIFVSDDTEDQGRLVNGHPVISFAELASNEHRDRQVSIAIGSGNARRLIAQRCNEAGLSIGSIFANTYVGYDDVTIGDGAVFCHNTMCTSNVTIGLNFQCNIYSYIAHDCIIGDFVTFAPGVHCNGNVHIEDDVYVGTGAFIKQGIRIGKGAVIGMGAVVTKDVLPGAVMVGNPSKPLAPAG